MSWAARLVPRLFVCWLICGGLYLVLTQFGQVSDLRRALNEDLLRHMLTTMGAMAITGLCLTLCLGAFQQEDDKQPPTVPALSGALLLGATAPAFLIFNTFGPEGELTAGALLASAALLGPFVVLAQLWLERGTLPIDKLLLLPRAIFATFAALLYAALLFAPVAMGTLMGPIAVLFTVSALLLWLLWFLATRTPLLLVGLLCTMAALLYHGVYGVREVRLLDEGDARPLATTHAREWLASRRAAILAVPRYPVYFVTSDGGGLRAAAWTTEVLGALADENGEFVRHTYLLSGVSGGSVGVALFAAGVAELSARPAAAVSPAAAASGAHRARAQNVLSRNYLAAPFAVLLTRDPLTSIFCLGLGWARTCSDPPQDRIIALEQAFEDAWAQTNASPRFEQSLQALWAAPGSELQVPALLLNTTHAHNGRTHVLSSFVDTSSGADQDLLARLPAGKSLRLSTAALLSARFPVVSPEGELTLAGQPEHFVDGGYFDNSGGAAAHAALPAFMEAVRAAGLQEHVLPVALVITNDGRRAARSFLPAGCTLATAESPGSKHKLGGMLSQPVGTLDAQRVNNSESRRRAWTDAVQQAGGVSIEISLFECAEDKDFEVPLGWALSAAARQQLQAKLERLRAQAGSPYRQVLALLSGREPLVQPR